MYLWNDPAATVVRSAREANAQMPQYAVDLLAAAYGDLTGVEVLVLGAAYRGGVKETAFSGVFPTVESLRARGAKPYVSDPMYTADELTALGLPPHTGEPVVAAVVQADHAEYRELSAADLPGVTRIVDGRGILDPARFDGVPVKRIGRP
jgi:UDP-N-acetyl-D-mannosaminuronate dehydrogenase